MAGAKSGVCCMMHYQKEKAVGLGLPGENKLNDNINTNSLFEKYKDVLNFEYESYREEIAEDLDKSCLEPETLKVRA